MSSEDMLRFIRVYTMENGRAPNYQTIAKRFSIGTTTVGRMFRVLESVGDIKRRNKRADSAYITRLGKKTLAINFPELNLEA